MDLLATAEQLRRVQSDFNSYERDGYAILAYQHSAWGDLDRAIRKTLAEWYVSAQGAPSEEARAMADRVIDEVYDNGENIAYNMRLLIDGVIEVYPPNH